MLQTTGDVEAGSGATPPGKFVIKRSEVENNFPKYRELSELAAKEGATVQVV